MLRYRVRFLDGVGRVSRDREIECQNDEEAMDRAAAMRHGWGMEVWRNEALICHFQAPLGRGMRSRPA